MNDFRQHQQQVVEICQRLVAKGYLKATGGNLSLRVPNRDAFVVTPSNYDYLKMQAEDVCVLDLSLNPLKDGRKPSIESGMHAGVYRHRADVHAIIHTHQEFASALAILGTPIPALFDEQVRFLGRSVEIVPYAPSGTWFLEKRIVRRLRNGHNAYILQNHGVLCFGHDVERAVHNLEILEKCAVAYLLALCTERKVSKIPLLVREIAFAKLKADQRIVAAGGKTSRGE